MDIKISPIKVSFLVSFLYEHPNDPEIDINFNGDYGETVEIALQNTLKRIDEEWFYKDSILTDYFPQNVQVHFQKSVIIESEEYFTELKPFHDFDKTELLNKLRNFLKKAS